MATKYKTSKRVSGKRKATGIKKSTSFHSKPAKQTIKPKKRKKGYTSAERRAYWVGVGYQAGSDGYGFGMRPDRVSGVMTAKQQESFRNGRVTAADLTYEFIPDLVAGQVSHQRKRKRKK